MTQPIYMDNHATTPLDPRALAAMMPYLTTEFGNASSRAHAFGWRAQEAVEKAREKVAHLIGARAQEVVFTSGATESDNMAIRGAAEANREKGDHLITQKTEHKAVLESCKRLEKEGFRVTWLDVGPDGRVDPDAVRRALDDRTVLVSVMLANNEIGSVHDVVAIGRITRERGVLFHTDAVQGIGKVPFSVDEANADLVSLSAHKMYGPKGVGALYVRRQPRARLAHIIFGGGQEKGLRSGTLNVPAIVGFGEACAIAEREMHDESARVSRLRDRLLAGVRARVDGVVVNGGMEHRLPGNLNLSFEHMDGEALLRALSPIAVSSGSTCTAAAMEASYVLKSLGVSDDLAYASVRFGLGRFNTEEEVDFAVELVAREVPRLREAMRAAGAAAGAGAAGL
jgi:cysteine desulfurase